MINYELNAAWAALIVFSGLGFFVFPAGIYIVFIEGINPVTLFVLAGLSLSAIFYAILWKMLLFWQREWDIESDNWRNQRKS